MVGLVTYLLGLKDLGFAFAATLAPHDVPFEAARPADLQV
jgi:hypothetical protein